MRAVPGATCEFICVRRPIYNPPGTGIASAEQALYDMVYIMRRRGMDPERHMTFRNLDTLNRKTLARLLRQYPRATARTVNTLVRRPNGVRRTLYTNT